ncbi:hypothetical protein MHBO_001064 [Bonamia ostreae]|uniref:Uncharacterized protein n=1 Tax=Bonamia ostreae TaxID=126728 RepID=A0ABV2AHP9_9EUKA
MKKFYENEISRQNNHSIALKNLNDEKMALFYEKIDAEKLNILNLYKFLFLQLKISYRFEEKGKMIEKKNDEINLLLSQNNGNIDYLKEMNYYQSQFDLLKEIQTGRNDLVKNLTAISPISYPNTTILKTKKSAFFKRKMSTFQTENSPGLIKPSFVFESEKILSKIPIPDLSALSFLVISDSILWIIKSFRVIETYIKYKKDFLIKAIFFNFVDLSTIKIDI